ncbi:conserved hypothetical protein [Gluconacetobacter diazotrophicus PA1 5]|uniref:Uncharacterized protein n=1 Tax=Gluconacetobacter diazotrophicus (strain ATCC 49037 / DSM 5601 / CCUG 37298 / CIP 103539 / LMG 7603 / PAl5) TaxID=272568 RepID=A9HSC7_GLUDA|nr:conserved hypothetical protein [Gluconacetobacter diazotrophicus PA1 5]
MMCWLFIAVGSVNRPVKSASLLGFYIQYDKRIEHLRILDEMEKIWESIRGDLRRSVSLFTLKVRTMSCFDFNGNDVFCRLTRWSAFYTAPRWRWFRPCSLLCDFRI